MRSLLALALLVPAASAGVIVVDPAGGHGSDFTQLDDAIAAAVSGDVILLRSGAYDGGFKIGDQAISLVADQDAKENVEFARKSGCILIEDRSYFYRVGAA